MYIKHIELSRFKSFGSTTAIPILPGFTVISGPNGSGKSNILDALLFALGLSSSKGMRAERLPDLVNQSHNKGRTVEASVTVTFALDEEDVPEAPLESAIPSGNNGTDNLLSNGQNDSLDGTSNSSSNGQTAKNSHSPAVPPPVDEWAVTRKLRVTSQGTYTSTYYVNGTPCTLTELHEQLAKLRIYPEGYNVVLQGDVTSIISMNARDRREIIDELAGVGEFDRKIAQAKEKLDDVKAQEDRFRIVEQELIATQEKLKGDRVKAEKYRKLRAELDNMLASEVVLQQRQLLEQKSAKEAELATNAQTTGELRQQFADLTETIAGTTQQLEELNARVQTLGEEEYLALSTEIATLNAELRASQRQQQELTNTYQANQASIVATQAEIDDLLKQAERLAEQKRDRDREIALFTLARDKQAEVVAKKRQECNAIAASATDWVAHQTQIYQTVEALQAAIDPKRQDRARLQESLHQRSLQLEALGAELEELEELQDTSEAADVTVYQTRAAEATALIQSVAIALGEAQAEQQTCKETIERLTQEQRVKNRQLDKLEAQAQVVNEVQGTRATQLILEANLAGVRGLVAQLGVVEPRYQLALEIAAGNRLGFLVVDNDDVAAKAIDLLKRERAGRATFLPLNKLTPFRNLPTLDRRNGAIDYALNLIEFERRFADVFAFVFGSTLVYERLDLARTHIGQYRMITLEGDLLETTGAMNGGSAPHRSGIHFGTPEPSESEEARQLRERLLEIDRMLGHLYQKLNTTQAAVAQYEEQLQTARDTQREAQLQVERAQDRETRVTKDRDRILEQIHRNRTAIDLGQAQIATLEVTLNDLEAQQQTAKQQLAELEQSSTHTDWQQAQEALQAQEQQLNTQELSLRTILQQLADTENQSQLAAEKIAQRQVRLQETRSAQTDLLNASTHAQTHSQQLETQIGQLQIRLDGLEQTLGAVKQERDACDRALRTHQSNKQQCEWQIEKAGERRTELAERLTQIQAALAQIELPDPLPEVPEGMSLEQLQLEQRRLQKRLQAMEPVNMMAIAEYEATTNRLTELSGKLETLNQERTELLLRIENFTTLRQRAFMQAFDAVNENFKTIFAELSDGDGHLQLENPTAPLSGGLNLVAHPKGKPVQHLASMSGGEKSLTALSFIFALQRYRPSPFYAFDEVDMFLDGANVERLSRMVRKQAESAQFIVVSLRRPMIEAAERTIGVTQARGAHTQVLGMELRAVRS